MGMPPVRLQCAPYSVSKNSGCPDTVQHLWIYGSWIMLWGHFFFGETCLTSRLLAVTYTHILHNSFGVLKQSTVVLNLNLLFTTP